MMNTKHLLKVWSERVASLAASGLHVAHFTGDQFRLIRVGGFCLASSVIRGATPSVFRPNPGSLRAFYKLHREDVFSTPLSSTL